MKKTIAAALALCMLGLCACGDNAGVTAKAGTGVEQSALASPLYDCETIQLPGISSAEKIKERDGTIYFLGWSESAGYILLYKYDMTAGECTRVECGTQHSNVRDYQFDDSGNLVVLYEVAPIDMDFEVVIATGTVEQKLGESVIEKLSPEGDSLWRYSITKEQWESKSKDDIVKLNASNIEAAGDKIVCFNSYIADKGASYQEAVFAVTESGLRIDMPDKTDTSLANAHQMTAFEGQVYLVSSTYPYSAVPVNFDEMEYGEKITLDIPDTNQSGMGNTFYSDGKTVYFYNASGAYEVNPADGSATQLLSWLQNDLQVSTIWGITGFGEKLIYTDEPDFGDGQSRAELTILTPKHESDKRIALTFGTLYLDSATRKAILEFNQNNDSYKIEIIDYSEYNTTNDDSAGADRLRMDIIQNKCPDIVELTDIPHSTVISAKAKGVFHDLEQLIKQDESFDIGDYFPSLIEALREKDGSLYELSPAFGVTTMAGKSDSFENYGGITWQSLLSLTDSLQEGQRPFGGDSSYGIMLLLLGLDSFVDWETGQCDFENETFVDYIEMLKDKLPKTASHEDYDEDGSAFRAGQNLLALVSVEGIGRYAHTVNAIGSDAVFVGLPSNTAKPAAFLPTCRLAISAKTENKEAAWEFVKYMMSSTDPRQLPAKIESFENQLQNAITPLADQPEMAVVDGLTVPLVSEAQAQALRELVDNANSIYVFDEAIYQIIDDELSDFWGDNATAAQAANRVQARVETILSERDG